MNTGGTPSSYLLNANNSNNKNNSNYLTSLINQEPPVLHKFLLKLTEELTDDSTELNQLVKMPFPTITTVSIRTIKTIKIYALIALCTRHNLKNVNYNMFLNQLFIKINFSGFQQTTAGSANNQPPQTPERNNNQQFGLFSSAAQPVAQNIPTTTSTNIFSSSLEFNFKQGDQHIFENIFSLCLEMGLSTLNELYDYPFSILFPVLEAVHWSRENPCLSWPSYAFDLIGRNDLTILKINCDLLLAESENQQMAIDKNSEENNNEDMDSISSSKTFIYEFLKKIFHVRNICFRFILIFNNYTQD